MACEQGRSDTVSALEMENFAPDPLAISSDHADLSNENHILINAGEIQHAFPLPNPFDQVGASPTESCEISFASAFSNPFDQVGASPTESCEISFASAFSNPLDQVGVSSTSLGEIRCAFPFPNPLDQAGASSTDLGEIQRALFTESGDIRHALLFPNHFDRAGASSDASWENAIDGGMVQLEGSCPTFPLDKILKATNNFDDALVVGTGGFGKVYKGLIDDGATTTVVAMKRLNAESKQGVEEFWTEVKLLSKLRHTHLVSLIGYCNENQEMILIYEYIACGTLASHLYKTSREESGKSISHLTWEQRLNICLGAARGLNYLHNGTEQGIIHRDVKSTNILLDENLVSKVSDFGLSKSITSHTTSHVSTNVKGTFGYLDPDYFYTKRLTKKSDVYAFGVVLLEVLCGRPPVDSRLEEEQISLILWAKICIQKGKLDRIIDPSLSGEAISQSHRHFAKLANKCLHTQPNKRPTMFEVVEILEIALALHEHKRRSQATVKIAFQGITLVPKGMNRWWREGKGNGGGPNLDVLTQAGFVLDNFRKKSFMLRALDLAIAWGIVPQYWEWVSSLLPRFSEVAKLNGCCWYTIGGKIEARLLSSQTTYAAYFVFKRGEENYGFSSFLVKAYVVLPSKKKITKVVCLKPQKSGPKWRAPEGGLPQPRKDAWMEVQLGEFFNGQGDNGEVEIQLRVLEILNWKSGIIVNRIELRPKVGS